MKLILLCILMLHAFHAAGDDLHIRFLKTKSGCTFIHRGVGDRTCELTIWSSGGSASWELLLRGIPKAGRIHYPEGPLKRLVSPSQPMMPADALRTQIWSVRAADLAKGELGIAFPLSEKTLLMLDPHRYAAAMVLTSYGEGSAAGASAWLSRVPAGDVSGGHTYDVARLPGTGLHVMGWGVLEGETTAAALSAGWLFHESRPAYWWLNASVAWDFPASSGSFGMLAAPADGPITAVDGTLCTELFVVEAEAAWLEHMPVSISGTYRYALEVPDPWPLGTVYPGSIKARGSIQWSPGTWRITAGASWEEDPNASRHELTWSIRGSEGNLSWGASGRYLLHAPDDPWRYQAFGVKNWEHERVRIALEKTAAGRAAVLTCSYTRRVSWGSFTVEYGGDGSASLLMTARL